MRISVIISILLFIWGYGHCSGTKINQRVSPCPTYINLFKKMNPTSAIMAFKQPYETFMGGLPKKYGCKKALFVKHFHAFQHEIEKRNNKKCTDLRRELKSYPIDAIQRERTKSWKKFMAGRPSLFGCNQVPFRKIVDTKLNEQLHANGHSVLSNEYEYLDENAIYSESETSDEEAHDSDEEILKSNEENESNEDYESSEENESYEEDESNKENDSNENLNFLEDEVVEDSLVEAFDDIRTSKKEKIAGTRGILSEMKYKSQADAAQEKFDALLSLYRNHENSRQELLDKEASHPDATDNDNLRYETSNLDGKENDLDNPIRWQI